MTSPRLPLSSRPTFLPDEISRREFATVFRGYDPSEVRTFLNQLSEQAAEAADRVAEVQKALAETQERVKNPELTEEMVTSLLGEQTAQILRSAREAATDTRQKAEEEVSRQLREAHDVTSRMKEEAEALLSQRSEEAERMAETVRNEAARDAEGVRRATNEEANAMRNEVADDSARERAELDAQLLRLREQSEREITEERSQARQQAREMVDTARSDAQALVDRTRDKQNELVEGLVRKRKIALAQVEELRAGRQRLLKAYKMVRSTLDEITVELERVEDEARQAATLGGHRAAATAEITQDDMDTVIEIETFDLDDDVSQGVIDLITAEEAVAAAEGPEEVGRPSGPFDYDAPDGGTPGGDTITEQRQHTEMIVVEEDGPSGLEVYDIDEDDDVEDEDVEDEAQSELRATATSLIIGEAYVAGEGEEMDRALKLRRDAVVGKARSQALRRLKRALQDEQDGLVSRIRNGDGQSVQALLGSPEDQAAVYHRAVVKLLREVIRTGASSVEGSTGVERGVIDRTGTAAARGFAAELVRDLRDGLVPVLEEVLSEDELPQGDDLVRSIEVPYDAVRGEFLETLVDERIGGMFDQGVALSRTS